MITKELFGTCSAGTVDAYTLKNANGTYATILTMGGIIQKFVKDGMDICLGYDTLEGYLAGTAYFGALIGRVGNRIADASFTLGGKTYTLAANNGKNSLHGGKVGFDRKIWDAKAEGDALVLHCFSSDGEEGFPGNLDVTVTYTLGEDDSLRIDYQATPDQDTLVNMTNHSYFNLNGGGSILEHTLWLDADGYTAPGPGNIPTGEIAPVAGTPLDFRAPKALGADIQDMPAKCYDHNFCLNGSGLRKTAQLKGEKLTMEMETTEPGVQIYCAKLSKPMAAKYGKEYLGYCFVCLEAQGYPDAIHHPNFPSVVVKAGDTYRQTTIYRLK